MESSQSEDTQGTTKLLSIRSRQCRATREDGSQCENFAIFGARICHIHGGAAAITLEQARERLTALVGPAIAVMYQTMYSQEGFCQHCGRSDNMPLALKAALAVMDRIGLGPKLKVEMAPPDLRTLSEDELLSQVEEIRMLIAQAKEDGGEQR